jgi:hypothetical protein
MRLEALRHLVIPVTAALGFGLGVAPVHASCAVVGDSIAVGVGCRMDECLTDAKGGIPSADVIARTHPADVLFISAGSNDPRNPQLEDNLMAIRAKASGAVVWIVPMAPTAAAAVGRVAAAHNDAMVKFEASTDGVHPRSYDELALSLRKYLK